MRITFKMKALFVMIPVLIVVSVVHTLVTIKTEKEMIRREILKRAATMTTLATKTGELPILSGNAELLQRTVAFLKATDDVASVTFYDSARRQLIHDGPPLRGAIPPLTADKPISMAEDAREFVYYAPVFIERVQEDIDIFQDPDKVRKVRENIGWIRLGFSKKTMYENQRHIVGDGLLLAFVFSLGGSILVYFLISIATRPLVRIVRVANGIAHGDLDQEMELGNANRDEIGTLALSFATMKNTIQHVLSETDALILAVRAGNLGVRSNADLYEGEWRKLVAGVNELTSSFAKAHAQLSEAKDAAEAANRAKSDFLSNMSHELRTPLNAILGYAQILKRQDNLTAGQCQQVEIMRSSAEHLLMLINDILDVGKIEANKMELEDHPFNLGLLLRQVYNITRLNAEEKRLFFTYEAATDLPEYLRGDERKLRQILLNLLSNAVKYTKQGGVTLRVGYDRASGGLFRCEVLDTGVGIPQEKLESVFEPFTQLVANRQVAEGTGLGLTITKRLIDLMQGTIHLESQPGQGSRFRVDIPLLLVASPGEALQQAEYTVMGYLGDRKRILVADDNANNASMLVALLEPLGFEVATARDGAEALADAGAHATDLAILDLVMPGMDGLECAERIRQLSLVRGIKLIGASAAVSRSSLKNEFIAACDDFIEKPIRIDLLLEKIRRLLQLTWELAPAPLEPSAAKSAAPPVLETLVPPPREQLEELHRLALLGDMRKVKVWAAQLQEEDDRYRLFSESLAELAASFKTKAVLKLVEFHLGMGGGEYD
ncbi:ATP-binding protein [Geomesophilobacter sediminis]|uniref:Sensory/regulatory protein RpfC n=1 Tax=Geomesophilobacter sediminis TaxID=2798584 RepID=A0A8J7IY48_9BACT|nr:ATP-binding protein [Geomesophilobacter sediminis]MBJ6725012.1 response regulator [Geomesophilobacter sediminis]